MKIDEHIIEITYKLSRAGLNNKAIYENLNISKSAFYKNVDLMDTIKKARTELRESVSNALLSNATNGDTASLIFLAKRLNLFSEDISINLNSPETALKSLENIVNASISVEHKNSLRGLIGEYIKAYETIELVKRVEELENREKEK